MQAEHLPGVAALQRACFPAPFPEELLWTPEHLAQHLRLFPEGQFVVVIGGQVAASASSLRISRDVWERHLSWEETTGGLSLSGHNPEGQVLFGADISVHPSLQGQGLGRTLYQARFDLVRRLDLDLYGTVCRIPDYQAQSGGLSPDEYAKQVADGTLSDRTMTPLLKMGLTFERVIENHMDDEESGDAAAVLVWRP